MTAWAGRGATDHDRHDVRTAAKGCDRKVNKLSGRSFARYVVAALCLVVLGGTMVVARDDSRWWVVIVLAVLVLIGATARRLLGR
jgi:hypothetical protein